MKIVVIGPGAIGCLFAARLREGGHDVWLLDHDAARAARLDRDGLRVARAGRTRAVAVRATADAAAVGAADWAVLCVKAYDTAAALARAQPLLAAPAGVVCLQNGIGNAEQAAAVASPDRVVCGVTAQGAIRRGDGRVVHAGDGPTLLAPFAPAAAARADGFAAVLRAAGLETAVHADAAGLLWSKLAVNAAINPVAALAGVPNGEVMRRPDLRATAAAAAREVEAVARALGIRLAVPDTVAEVERVCALTAANRCSMLQDLARAPRPGHPRRTEIDAINGAVCRAAAARGVPVPVNAALVARIRERES